jgi:hypothetical protein
MKDVKELIQNIIPMRIQKLNATNHLRIIFTTPHSFDGGFIKQIK